jgi:hypothetical protein
MTTDKALTLTFPLTSPTVSLRLPENALSGTIPSFLSELSRLGKYL